MRTDSRLPRVLHVLLHLEQIRDPVTSDQLGEMFGMNPSLVRRTMAGLRNAGFVRSNKGHGGGWYLALSLADISLFDVYAALGSPNLFAMGESTDTPDCLLERAANAATADALQAAQQTFDESLKAVTVADLVAPARLKILEAQARGRPQNGRGR